ncbi:MAG: HlyD family type I secretion periplasmic adaptor subunit [Rhodospirillales bacterium]|nr:HlyD family type I secretion periplasmic adaptor subunit [Rhodospirillales bacterium]MBO6786379.1 HlyD family type I secretion periplasmic adaptor subunit [Rhodospirillales bacterium]
MSDQPDLQTPADDEVQRGTHMFLGLCTAAVVLFAIWATSAELDIVSVATGEVAPSTNVQSVDHLEGGIVRTILVKEGDRVAAGQPLVELEQTQSGADVQELKIRLRSLLADISRFKSELAGKEAPVFPPALIKAEPELIKQAIGLFQTRKTRKQGQVRAQQDAIRQRELEIKEVQSRRESARKSLELITEQIEISEKLLAKELTNRMLHLNLLKEAADLRGRIDEAEAALPRLRAALGEARANMETIRATFREEAQTELDKVTREMEELSQRIRKSEDSLNRTTLRAPVDGIVKTLHVVSVGGVVKAGSTVVDIVPADDRLIIEAQLPPQDIGYVRAGQNAKVTLASADAAKFGDLKGTVDLVSPDTLVTEDGRPFYKVRISTDRSFFEDGKLRYDLFPGMQVVASIQTGSRTIMEYILDPLIGRMQDALRER